MIVLKQFLAKIGRFSFVLELKAVEGMDRFISTMLLNTKTTRQSKHCGFSIYIFDNSKSIMKKVKINGQVGQGEEDGLVWSGLC